MPKPQVQANGHLKLTDDDYIHWARRSRWTVNEAVSLLHGELPEGECSRVELIERFPDARRLLESPWGADDFHETPAMWVQQASRGGVTIDKAWEAKFPYSVKKRLFSPDEPDFRDFVDCFVRNVKSPLRDLVNFALGERFEWPDNVPEHVSSLLKRIHGELPGRDQVRRRKEMGDILVNPRWFIETCLRLDVNVNEKCRTWDRWIKEYPKYLAWLSSPAKKAKTAPEPSPREWEQHDDVEQAIREAKQDGKKISNIAAARLVKKSNPLGYEGVSAESIARAYRKGKRSN